MCRMAQWRGAGARGWLVERHPILKGGRGLRGCGGRLGAVVEVHISSLPVASVFLLEACRRVIHRAERIPTGGAWGDHGPLGDERWGRIGEGRGRGRRGAEGTASPPPAPQGRACPTGRRGGLCADAGRGDVCGQSAPPLLSGRADNKDRRR